MGLFGFGAKKIIDSVGNSALKLRTALTGDLPPDTKVQLETILADLDAQVIAGQDRANTRDAMKGFIYAGWRVMTGWTCAIGLSIHVVVNPIMSWFTLKTLNIDIQTVLTLIVPLLGLGLMRSYEKKHGVHKEH